MKSLVAAVCLFALMSSLALAGHRQHDFDAVDSSYGTGGMYATGATVAGMNTVLLGNSNSRDRHLGRNNRPVRVVVEKPRMVPIRVVPAPVVARYDRPHHRPHRDTTSTVTRIIRKLLR